MNQKVVDYIRIARKLELGFKPLSADYNIRQESNYARVVISSNAKGGAIYSVDLDMFIGLARAFRMSYYVTTSVEGQTELVIS